MNPRELKSIIEGLLYVWAEPLPIDDLASILSITSAETQRLLQEMQDEMEHQRRGLHIQFAGDAVLLTTRAEHASYFAKLYGPARSRTLSNSAMETLAIIAYKQPVTRVEVDAIRGVKSSSAIDTLLERNLIEEAGRLEQIGRPILYRTTREFLRAFQMTSLEDLPSKEEMEQRLEQRNED